MMRLCNPTSLNVRNCVELTRQLLREFLHEPAVPVEQCWQQFWHMTRIVEWPWAIDWIEDGDKVFDVGSDPTFGLHCLRNGVVDFTMHHTCFDTEHLGRILIHSVGWITAAPIFRKHARKLKMVWGYPDQIDIPDETYDVVTNLSVMEHVEPENWRSWMDFCWRILKPGGLLVMSCDYLVGEHPDEGQKIDITNHPYWEFFSEKMGWGFQHSMTHVPWHPSYDPSQLVDDPDVLVVSHPANRDGKFTVYGFVVRKDKR